MARLGSQNISNQTDVAVGVSGRGCRVYSLTVQSGGTAAVVILRNGTSASGTAYAQLDGTISKTIIMNWAGGLWFPGGCFCDVDANTTYATVGYEHEI